MGDVIERPGKHGPRYYLRFVDADGVRRCRAAKGAKNMRQALTKLHDAEAAARRGEQVARAKATETEKRQRMITVRELAKRFGEDARPSSKKNYLPTPRVIAAYRVSMKSLLNRHVIPRIGDKPAALIDSMDVEKIRDGVLDDGFALDTAGKMLTALSRLYDWSRRERLIACANPCKGVTRPKADMGSPDYLTAEECGKLIAWTAQHGELMLHAMVVLGLTSAMRKGEMFGLIKDRLHLDAGRIDVEASYDAQTKTAKPRSLRLHPAAIPVLRQWLQACPDTPQGLVFPVSAGKGQWRMGTTDDMLDINRALLKSIGRMHERPWHLLRHSAASNLVMRGASLYSVQAILGHSDPKMTMRYAKLSPDFLADEAQRLSFPLPGAGATDTDISAARSRQDVDRNVDIDVTTSTEVADTISK